MILAFVVCIGDIYFDSVTENTDGDRRGQSSIEGKTMSNFKKSKPFIVRGLLAILMAA